MSMEMATSLEGLAHRKSTPKKQDEMNTSKFVCSECGAIFADRSGLRRHVRRHSGQYAKTCDICGKGFFDIVAYTNHYNKHTGLKNFMCDICTKTFCSKYSLQRHAEICQGGNSSENAQQFPCPSCDKKFPVKRYLDAHIARYHGKHFASYPCQDCGRRFQYRSSLSYHRDFGKCSGKEEQSESKMSEPNDENTGQEESQTSIDSIDRSSIKEESKTICDTGKE